MLIRLTFILAVVVISCTPLARALTFNVSTPTSCDDLRMTWTGGTAPFLVFLTPVFGTPRVVNVSSSAFNNGQGSFKMQLPFPAKQKILATLFDANQASVTTDVLVVGNSLGGSCNTKDPGVDFTFELNTALQQCRPYTFSGYSGATQPAVIFGLIPLGQTFVLLPPSQSTTFNWVANVAAGTSIVFVMLDAQGHNGGSSDIKQVGISDDSSCLSNSSPSSTANPTPTSTSSTSTSVVGAPPTSSASPSHGLSTGVIVGGAAGGLIFIAALGGLIFFLFRNRSSSRYQGRSDIDLSYEPNSLASKVYPYPISSSTNLTQADSPPPHSPPQHFVPPTQYEPRPFILPTSDAESSAYPRSRHSMSNSQSDLLSPEFGEQSGSSSNFTPSSRRKAAMAGATSYKPSRFIVHTDVDEAPPPEEDVIELPPQYSDNRRPLQIVNPHDPASSPPPLARQSKNGSELHSPF